MVLRTLKAQRDGREGGMFQIPLQEKLDRENDRRSVTRGGGKENLNTDHCGAQRAKKKSEDERRETKHGRSIVQLQGQQKTVARFNYKTKSFIYSSFNKTPHTAKHSSVFRARDSRRIRMGENRSKREMMKGLIPVIIEYHRVIDEDLEEG